jgi:protein phosphatase PTC7
VVHTSLIGDSAYYIFRPDGKTFNLIYESQDQLHGFNFPYQIGSKGDDPSVAIAKTHANLQNDDLIIAVTDGVSDNLFTK